MSRFFVAITCLLTLFFAWLPLALGGFGSFIFFGLIFYLIPAVILFLPAALILLIRHKHFFSLGRPKRFLVVLGTLSFCVLTPWIFLSSYLFPFVPIDIGYWIVASVFLLFGSLVSTLIKHNRGSEQAAPVQPLPAAQFR